MDSNMRVIIIEPEKRVRIEEIDKGLKSMQAVVGGYIQIIAAAAIQGCNTLSRDLVLVLNEEGKLDNLTYNFDLWNGEDFIVGTCFICKQQEDDLVGLTEEEANLVVSLIGRMEKVNG